ncbi:MAG: AmmeMemoRadiSam system radical SAM enzyme [Candidatus Micrarchaeia archaeon]|jgi:pyruvate formate lyase activating enzyme
MAEKKLHEALLYDAVQGSAVKCKLCARYCTIPDGKYGFCLVRKNEAGKLFTLSYGKSTGLAVDPIEKKPFFHFKPGSRVLSFGTPGCNFRCLNCQNWELSQGPRESLSPEEALAMRETSPKEIARRAVNENCGGVAYTYSEPTIFFEYARDTVLETRRIAPEKSHMFVSNGYFTKEAFELMQKEKLLDAIRIDLKFINNDKYLETTGGSLAPVLDSIKRVYSTRRSAHKVHLEIIALIIPTLNDSPDDLHELSRFVASVGKDIPLHFIRFFPYHKMANLPETPLSTLVEAKKIAEAEGLEYVFIGNTGLPHVEDTVCPKCKTTLVARSGMRVLSNVFEKAQKTKTPACPKCGEKINIVL